MKNTYQCHFCQAITEADGIEFITECGYCGRERPTVRNAARMRLPLDGSDAQALEGALQQAERQVTDLQAQLKQAQVERDAARELLNCRAGKLLLKGKPFVVVANDEPYYEDVYATIRQHERLIERWSEEDEQIFRDACPNYGKDYEHQFPRLTQSLQAAMLEMNEHLRIKQERDAAKAALGRAVEALASQAVHPVLSQPIGGPLIGWVCHLCWAQHDIRDRLTHEPTCILADPTAQSAAEEYTRLRAQAEAARLVYQSYQRCQAGETALPLTPGEMREFVEMMESVEGEGK